VTLHPETTARVRAIIAQVARRDMTNVSDEDDLVEALAVDSLQGLQILAAVEKRFGIRIPDDELVHQRTIRRIAETVDRVHKGGAV
jgi:acyl carrier protein